ncbi:MAG: hypothetical protein ACRDHF_16910 [Tepidiformaceae bacterium]
MKSLLRLTLVLGFMAVGGPKSAQADSDGYYCIGPDYIAYELWMQEPGATHHLYVLSLVGSARVTKPAGSPLD